MTPDDRALLEQHIKGIQAALDGLPWQVSPIDRIPPKYEDAERGLSILHSVLNGFLLRPKPQPRVVPWTLETCPVGKEVIHKSTRNRYQIIAATDCEALLWTERAAYTCLLAYYVMADGSPCGSVEAGA